jgi:hypothetical protein
MRTRLSLGFPLNTEEILARRRVYVNKLERVYRLRGMVGRAFNRHIIILRKDAESRKRAMHNCAITDTERYTCLKSLYEMSLFNIKSLLYLRSSFLKMFFKLRRSKNKKLFRHLGIKRLSGLVSKAKLVLENKQRDSRIGIRGNYLSRTLSTSHVVHNRGGIATKNMLRKSSIYKKLILFVKRSKNSFFRSLSRKCRRMYDLKRSTIIASIHRLSKYSFSTISSFIYSVHSRHFIRYRKALATCMAVRRINVVRVAGRTCVLDVKRNTLGSKILGTTNSLTNIIHSIYKLNAIKLRVPQTAVISNRALFNAHVRTHKKRFLRLSRNVMYGMHLRGLRTLRMAARIINKRRSTHYNTSVRRKRTNVYRIRSRYKCKKKNYVPGKRKHLKRLIRYMKKKHSRTKSKGIRLIKKARFDKMSPKKTTASSLRKQKRAAAFKQRAAYLKKINAYLKRRAVYLKKRAAKRRFLFMQRKRALLFMFVFGRRTFSSNSVSSLRQRRLRTRAFKIFRKYHRRRHGKRSRRSVHAHRKKWHSKEGRTVSNKSIKGKKHTNNQSSKGKEKKHNVNNQGKGKKQNENQSSKGKGKRRNRKEHKSRRSNSRHALSSSNMWLKRSSQERRLAILNHLRGVRKMSKHELVSLLQYRNHLNFKARSRRGEIPYRLTLKFLDSFNDPDDKFVLRTKRRLKVKGRMLRRRYQYSRVNMLRTLPSFLSMLVRLFNITKSKFNDFMGGHDSVSVDPDVYFHSVFKRFLLFWRAVIFFKCFRKTLNLPDCLIFFNPDNSISQINDFSGVNIPIISVVDTITDIFRVTYPIPSNDDSVILLLFYFSLFLNACDAGITTRYVDFY